MKHHQKYSNDANWIKLAYQYTQYKCTHLDIKKFFNYSKENICKYHQKHVQMNPFFSPVLCDKNYITCYVIFFRDRFSPKLMILIRYKRISMRLNFFPFPLSLDIRLNNCWCLYFTFDEQIYHSFVIGNMNVATFGFEITDSVLKINYRYEVTKIKVLHVKINIGI